MGDNVLLVWVGRSTDRGNTSTHEQVQEPVHNWYRMRTQVSTHAHSQNVLELTQPINTGWFM